MHLKNLLDRSMLSLLLLTFACVIPAAVNAQTVASIPSPLPDAWVVDQTETLSDLQRKLIGELCEEIQTDYNRQMVVAVIDSTRGRDHRRFAVELFNKWRIGDGYKNQGVLIFAAMEDRAAEIILGHGIDNRATVQAAQSIMDNVMLPKFKAGDAGSAIYEGAHASAKRIIGVGQLDVAPKLPEITAEQPIVTAEKPFEPGAELPLPSESNAKADASVGSSDSVEAGSTSPPGTDASSENTLVAADKAQQAADVPVAARAESDGFVPVKLSPRPVANRPGPSNRADQRRPLGKRGPTYLPWIIGFGGVGLIASFFGVRHYLRYRSRMCETCRLDRVLLTEVQDDDFLDKPQRIEEKIGSVDYDIWACLECEDVIKLRYGRWFTRYSRCPECSYVTRFKITETVIPATTMNDGLVRVKEFCKACDYHHTHTYATPRIPKRRSGSSGSVFSGGSRSGGGFSSGGGASGRW